MLGGWGVSQALHGRWTWQVATLIPLAAYLGCMIPVTRIASRWWLRPQPGSARTGPGRPGGRGRRTRARRSFWMALQATFIMPSLADSALHFGRSEEVYLTPGAGDTIQPVNDQGRFPHLVMEPGPMRKCHHPRRGCGILRCRRSPPEHYGGLGAVSFRFASRPGTPSDRSRKSLLGICSVPSGFRWRTGFRWMPARATVHLGGPRSPKDQLLLEGLLPAATKSGRCASFSIGRWNIAGECTNYQSGKQFPSSIRYAAVADRKVDGDRRDSGGPGDPRAWRARAGVDFRDDRDSVVPASNWY